MSYLENKIIWTYWHQGFENAPWVVKRCIQQLQDLHPQWKIHLLDALHVNEFSEPLPIRSRTLNRMSLPHRSDLIRTQLLIKNGGVWMDPTIFCIKPLDDWLLSYLNSGLFMFYKPNRDRIISNWFIAANPQNPLLIKAYDELCSYWDQHDFRNLGRKEKTMVENLLHRIINRNLDWPLIWFTPIMTRWLKLYPYMVYHYKVYDLIKREEKCAAIWSETKIFSADFPHKLQLFGLLNPLDANAKQWIDEKRSPLFKLSWKVGADAPPKGSIIDYLFKV